MQAVNGSDFKKMVEGGVAALDLNRSMIDELNVFPVPDGDTGTNMSLTINSALRGLNESSGTKLSELALDFSKGALRGARGNSGVITSQIMKGFAVALGEKEEMTAKDFAESLKQGTEIAYGAVTKPKEGTILTVIRVMAETAITITKKKTLEIEDFLQQILQAGEEILAQTPEMLPVLKKAGVVDAGGKGLLTIFYGFLSALKGEKIELKQEPQKVKPALENVSEDFFDNDYENITFAYCTEYFITNIKSKTTLSDIDTLRDLLMQIGDCVLVIGDLDLIKVHVHTNSPDKALKYALNLGELDSLKIENMLQQHRQIVAKREAEKPKEKKECGIVSICAGKGLADIFRDLGCDFVAEGGQTMNPSVYDILNAINKVNAKQVYVLPNNGNIILAAQQAKELADVNVCVIPSKTVPEGIAAMVAFDHTAEVNTNEKNMNNAVSSVITAEVTHAVRNTRMNGFAVKEGDIIGISDKKIVAVGQSVDDTVVDTICASKKDNIEMVTLYYGEDVSEETANGLLSRLEELFPDMEFAAYFGGQPHYYYMISLE